MSYRDATTASAREGGTSHSFQQLPRTRVSNTRSETAAQYEEQCREALRASLRTAAEATAISQQTAQQLNQQSDQLLRIQDDVHTVSHHLDTSQYLITGMKSWWGSMVQLFTNPPLPSNASSVGTAKVPSSVPAQTSSPIQHRSTLPPDISNSSIKQTVFSSSARSDGLPLLQEQQDHEFDQGLNDLSGMLSDLHSQAVEIGQALRSHNTMLDDIHVKVAHNVDRMTRQKHDLDYMLKRR